MQNIDLNIGGYSSLHNEVLQNENVSITVAEMELAEEIPDSISQALDDRFHVDHLCRLAKAFQACSVQHWQQFGRSSLKLSPSSIENIFHDHAERSAQIVMMFRQWYEINSEEITFRKIIEIFDTAKLVGIKQRWFARYRDENSQQVESYFRKYREKIDELCHKIVSEEDWMSCLRRLRIDDMHPEVEAMRGGLVLKRTKILFMYEDRFGFGREATTRLFNALEDLQERRSTRQYSDHALPFLERIRSTRIRRCQGCRGDIGPSDEKVIAHWEFVKYRKNGILQGKETYGHYHFNEECVRRNHRRFRMEDLIRLNDGD